MGTSNNIRTDAIAQFTCTPLNLSIQHSKRKHIELLLTIVKSTVQVRGTKLNKKRALHRIDNEAIYYH